MKVFLRKGLVARRINLRFVAIICFAVAIFVVWILPMQSEQTPSRFLVQVLPNRELVIQQRRPPEIILKKILQKRDLSKYDFGGVVFDCNSVLDEMQYCESIRQNAREFISEHWLNKKQGYLIIDFMGFDSGSTAHVFIEPDVHKRWQIVWKWEPFRDEESERINVEIARSMKAEVGVDKNTNKFGKSYLSFFNKNGKGIQTF